MRKYNDKTKKTIITIIALFMGIVVIFSLFLKKAIDVGKTVYKVTTSSVLFDKDQNMITTTQDSTIRIKWAGDYYLTYNDKEYDLGKHAVVYHANDGSINLYGKYYEVKRNGDVKTIKGDNVVKSSESSKFYKLADRKYLIIDKTIASKNSSFVTSNYLIINLDKLGNATLLNDKTSYKTIVPTVLRTSSYTFDIANEKLNFGAEDIDLKKIIGSTNEYDEETYNLNAMKDKEEDASGTGTGNGSGNGTGDGTGTGTNGEGGNGTGTNGEGGTGTGANGTGNGTNGNGTTVDSISEYTNNYSEVISDAVVQEIINATKNTSVIRISPGINNISVDYVVYDPKNEYKSVYVEVENSETSNINTIYLSKTDTNINIRELAPNVYYKLTFKYTYYDENKELKEYKFAEEGLKTVVPKISIVATKIVNKKIYYKITLDKSYTVSGGTINLYLNNQFTNITANVPTKGKVMSISGSDCYLDISSLKLNSDNENLLSVRLVNLGFDTYNINPKAIYNFRY